MALDADVIVVGGGLAGLVAAAEISDKGKRVIIVEQEPEQSLGGQAFFMGWRDPVDDLLAGFTLYTLASRSEGTSIGLLEAMSAGCCPVVTDVGGNRHVLGPELARMVGIAADFQRSKENQLREAE